MTATAAAASAVSAEMAVRDWLRTVPAVLNAVSGDSRTIDLDAPPAPANGARRGAILNYLTMFRTGGSPVPGLPMEQALLSFHCYGSSRKRADDLRLALQEALLSAHGVQLNSGTYLYGATVESVNWLPAEDHPRYVLYSTVTTRRTA